MAEVIGAASGILALAAFAFKSSMSLYRVVESFHSSKRTVRELKIELETLSAALASLQQALSEHSIDLPALDLPLQRCGRSCEEFEAVIVSCAGHPSGSRTSFRDWARLRYMGEDIDGFRNMIAGYKATISIALGEANLRTTAITANALMEYKELITNTTSDLEEHLHQINQRLQVLSLAALQASENDIVERDRTREERDSTETCISICSELSERVDHFRPNVFVDISTAQDDNDVSITRASQQLSAKKMTSHALQECHKKLVNTRGELQRHLVSLPETLYGSASPPTNAHGQASAEKRRVQEQIDTIKQCLAICQQAASQAEQTRTNTFDDVLADQDAHQVIIATLGDLVSAKKVHAGVRATQWLGQMTDESFQELSRQRGVGQANALQSQTSQSKVSAGFDDAYGAGQKVGSCAA